MAAGCSVCGEDLNSDFVQSINDRTFLSPEPEVTNRLRAETNLRTTGFVEEGVNISELMFICVDTASSGDDRYHDTFKLESVLKSIKSVGEARTKAPRENRARAGSPGK
jgi:UDP-glucose 6-dehydrogenase